ncbi:hypothetical protein Celaphus_00010195 [Cervus elaphus hippelaphus]|uniref:Uncharacterized protein n=1 Tax=Cervus elaphus hippelaphus TaxID=46360 RepID=A0A212C8W5_CEREH|nr:hypothetical protein Celaphus_00010195 [Cervus elaphus hippelaphus]
MDFRAISEQRIRSLAQLLTVLHGQCLCLEGTQFLLKELEQMLEQALEHTTTHKKSEEECGEEANTGEKGSEKGHSKHLKTWKQRPELEERGRGSIQDLLVIKVAGVPCDAGRVVIESPDSSEFQLKTPPCNPTPAGMA